LARPHQKKETARTFIDDHVGSMVRDPGSIITNQISLCDSKRTQGEERAHLDVRRREGGLDR
jgi:hypothetical protein